MSETANDPIVTALNIVATGAEVRAVVRAALHRVLTALSTHPTRMAWETVPLSGLGTALPPMIQSCWIFVIRPGEATGAERHPDSHQRSLSLCGTGAFELHTAGGWNRHQLESTDLGGVDGRWVTIPPNTWHRLFAGPSPWGMLSFHTVKAEALIEERPVSEHDLTGPTVRQGYEAR